MATQSKGKKFEAQFRSDWIETVPNSFCYRLNDQTSGYYGASRNISDFICFKQPYLYLLETKTIKGNTFPVDFRQYDELIKYKDTQGVNAGVVVWFYEHENCIVYIPIKTFEQLKLDDKKSFNVKMIGSDEYKHFVIPSIKKRTFYNSDYSKLVEFCEGELDGDNNRRNIS